LFSTKAFRHNFIETGSFFAALAQLCNNELLLDHLNLLVESLKVQVIELINMLKENPSRRKSCPIHELHERFHSNIWTKAVELLHRSCTYVSKLLKDVPAVVMSRHAPQ